jgi:hypothetical protein
MLVQSCRAKRSKQSDTESASNPGGLHRDGGKCRVSAVPGEPPLLFSWQYSRARTAFHGVGKIRIFNGSPPPALNSPRRARAKAANLDRTQKPDLTLLRATPCEPGDTPCPIDYFALRGAEPVAGAAAITMAGA